MQICAWPPRAGVQGIGADGQAAQRSNCPTCRQTFHGEEVSYVDGRAAVSAAGDGSNGSDDVADEEAAIPVVGSYGTKVVAHRES